MRIDIYERTEHDGMTAEFKRVGVTDKATNISMENCLYSKGEFSFNISSRLDAAKTIKNGSVVCMGEFFWGVVTTPNKVFDNNGGIYPIRGRSLKWHTLNSRIILPTNYTSVDGTAGYDKATGYTDAVIKHFWRNNISSPPQAARKIPGVVVTDDTTIGIADDKYMSRFENVAEVTELLCKNAKIGFDATVNPATGIITLSCIAGVNRTASQSQNPRAIFEISRKNIASISYEYDASDYKNAYYTTRSGAEFADEALTLLYFRDDMERSGMNRRETWQEVSTETPISGDEYTEIKKQAQKGMKDGEIKEAFTCTLTPNAGYRTLWNVGDTVTVIWREENLTADMQITAVTTTADGNNINHVAKFGESKPRYIGAGNQIIKI